MCAARRYHRSERSATYAKRALRFPETADLSSVKAKYENGTLSVEVCAATSQLLPLTAHFPRNQIIELARADA